MFHCSSPKVTTISFPYYMVRYTRIYYQEPLTQTFTRIFKMHDSMHDLASSLAQKECSFITSQNHTISKTIRHLSVLDFDSFFRQALPKFPNKFDRVRTLLFASRIEGPCCKTEFENSLSKFKHLRLLELMDDCELLPEKIGALKHLRYLQLGGTLKFERLPKSIFKLQNLQALLLSEGVEELPKDVRYMISLRFLYLNTKQERLPDGGIGRLECLQTLFITGNPEYLCEDMQGLKSLRKLCIMECHSLISLPRSIKYLTALEFLMISYPNLALPEQFIQASVDSLQTFDIGECPNIRKLPEVMGDLKELQILVIWDCPGLRERCQRATREDWSKIAHIPQIIVDHVDIQQTS